MKLTEYRKKKHSGTLREPLQKPYCTLCCNKGHIQKRTDDMKPRSIILWLCEVNEAAMRRRRIWRFCPLHSWGAEPQSSCWSHDCGTVFPGVGCAISPAIWVNRRGLLLRHEASPPDPALLTLGRGTATRGQMAPMVGDSCLPQDGMTGGPLHWGFFVWGVSWQQHHTPTLKWSWDIRLLLACFAACYADNLLPCLSLIFSTVAILTRSPWKEIYNLSGTCPFNK